MSVTKSILKFVTMGSVDDGKSTLIGRLLYDTNSVYFDQYESIKKTSQKKGFDKPDLSLITDGLKSEREQGITIDVAYRYFSTDKRKFIVADCPGHIQYTKNTITGASHSDCSIILIDAKNGITEQTKRHVFISSILQIDHMLVVVNKMDLVNYSEDIFNSIINEFNVFLDKTDIKDVTFIPVSSFIGDNVVINSNNMEWHKGSTVLDYLENVYVQLNSNIIDFRFPIQLVVRSNNFFRGYAGEIVSGGIKIGQEIVVLPSNRKTKVKKIFKNNEEVEYAREGNVIISVENEIDISRGNMFVKLENQPTSYNSFESIVCWFDNKPLEITKTYLLKHTTKVTRAYIRDIRYLIDINTLHRKDSHFLGQNDIGRLNIETVDNLFFDPYNINKRTGSFILIDPDSCNTVAAGFIKFKNKEDISTTKITVWDREKKNGHKGKILWFTGFSGAGKSTIAEEIERRLFKTNHQVILLDGDKIREGLCKDLSFETEDRNENIRRIGEIAKILVEHGMIVLCTFISPFKKQRDYVRSIVEKDQFIEIYVHCSLDECERRDVKGLYKKYRNGEIEFFTGFTSPYEPPINPEIVLFTKDNTIDQCVDRVIELI